MNICNERVSLALGHEQRSDPGCIGGELCGVFLGRDTSARLVMKGADSNRAATLARIQDAVRISVTPAKAGV